MSSRLKITKEEYLAIERKAKVKSEHWDDNDYRNNNSRRRQVAEIQTG